MMGMYRSIFLIPAVFLLHLLFLHVPSAFTGSEGPLTEQIRTTVENVLGVLENSSLVEDSDGKRQNPEAMAKYRADLRKVILPQFDIPEMAKRSLGLNWRPRTSAEQKEFVDLFSFLLEDFLSDKLKSFEDEKFVYTGEVKDGDYGKVETRIITREGKEISIDYRFHLVDEDWKVYDMVIENVSLVKNYRSQFNRIIAKTSYRNLVRRIQKMTNK
jgi:phospholipid transport system substrate-binding protein